MSKILLVDDDVELSTMLGEYLEQEGFEVGIRHDGESGAAEALSGGYDMVVLDVMMPRLNGVEALRRIRAESAMPVLMLTAKGDDVDRIIGLELGADDYVPKPCTPRELVARIRAILRRSGNERGSESGVMVVGPLSLWPERRTAEWAGAQLELTSTEFNLLEVLARNAGRVVSKSDLSEQALGRPLTRFDRSIDVHMSSIRHKLGPRADGQSWIMTVRGMGYQLVKD
ncbi:MAG: response regulator transcription factor [Zoogloeaceae bacterium]|nr:response regulator transcription factor [Zoogloeaceae bacterium]MCP5253747.1 response regulator transcription factor [Zoogloeaceae bacterium]MCP5293863.1 response regulator transcription factor [Zoogloeaceae bacterium]